jgi:hypothetical protein
MKGCENIPRILTIFSVAGVDIKDIPKVNDKGQIFIKLFFTVINVLDQ